MNRKLAFLSYFSMDYVVQGLTSIKSFLKFHPSSHGFVVLMDIEAKRIVEQTLSSTNVLVMEISELTMIKREFDRFLRDRNYSEAMLSIKPMLIRHFLDHLDPEILLLFFDSDIFFYGRLELDQFLNTDVILSKHLFPPQLASSERYGKFNAGFILFANTKNSFKILNEWGSNVSEWCRLSVSDNRYADQKYLDKFEHLSRVNVLEDPGINNRQSYFLLPRKLKRVNKSIKIGSFDLVCFHFHGIRIHSNFISTGFNRYGLVRKPFSVWRLLYSPYIKALRAEIFEIMSKTKMSSSQLFKCYASNSAIKILIQRARFTIVKTNQKNCGISGGSV